MTHFLKEMAVALGQIKNIDARIHVILAKLLENVGPLLTNLLHQMIVRIWSKEKLTGLSHLLEKS